MPHLFFGNSSMIKRLEGYDPQIKFKMGISAYMIGNYDKARNYLAGYDNDFVRNLLESISSRETEDEWKRWIKQNNPTTSEVVSQDEVSTSTAVTVTQPSSGSSNVAIIIVIFSTTFVVLMIAEYRIYRVKRKVIELPLESRQRASAQRSNQKLQVPIHPILLRYPAKPVNLLTQPKRVQLTKHPQSLI